MEGSNRNQNSNKISLSISLQRLILGIIFVTVISFLVSSYIIIERERMDYARRESDSILKTVSNSISSNIGNYRELSRLIMTEEHLLKFLRADSDSVDISMINDARYGIMSILNVKEGVDTVIIIREDMILVSTNRFTYKFNKDLMETQEWRKNIYDGKGRAVVSLHTFGVAQKTIQYPVVSIGRAIYDIDSQERTGILIMNISASVLNRILNALPHNDICIMGTDGSYLAGNREYTKYYDEAFLSKEIVHKGEGAGRNGILVSGCKVENMPIVLIRVSPYGDEGIPFRMLYVLIALMLIFILVAAYVGVFIRNNLTKPVYELSDSMENNRQSGELKKIDVSMPYSELELLEGDYNRLIDHVNELIDKLIEKEKTLQNSQMRVLQEQIKPHFLYNSIETIGFLALDAGAENVHDALETLGSFYRNFLSKGGREIPLSREIKIVKDYLSLQRLRYGDIIQDVYNIEEGTENFIVPKLILQPLVENSIYHGIRLKGEPGVISISSSLKEGELHLLIRDTGVGMEQDIINKVLSTDRSARPGEADESFGLWGTIERIRMYCGRDDVVNIRSEIGEFTEIEIIIVNQIED